MFDTYQVGKNTTTYVPYEKTIIEKKAPTDDSIKLLNEFQEKATHNIIDSICIKNNIIEGIAIEVNESVWDFSTSIFFKFILNGKNIQFKIDRKHEDKTPLSDFLMRAMSEEISFLIFKDIEILKLNKVK
jgi:hypothetical protein